MPSISPGSGYIRLDIRPSPRLQAAIRRWSLDHGDGMPMAAASRTLIWLGLQAAGIEPERATKRLKPRPEIVRTEGHDVRED